MSTSHGGSGWHPDPTGTHQLRYYNEGWTEHVSDNGVQSVSPLPLAEPAQQVSEAAPVAQAPPVAQASPVAQVAQPSSPPATAQGTRRRKTRWVVAGLALVVAAVVAIAVLSNSSDDGDDSAGGSGLADSGIDQTTSFCDDFAGTWGAVNGGMINAESLMNSAATNPNFTGGTTDEINSVNQAAQNASVIAAEAPDDIKDQVATISDFLGLAVLLAQGDTSVIGQMTSLNISVEDSAYLLGTVPMGTCSGS